MSASGVEAAAWIGLRMAERVGAVLARRLLARFGTPWKVLEAEAPALATVGLTPSQMRALAEARVDVGEATREAARMVAAGARLVACTDAEYPSLLGPLDDAPPYLVARGEPLADGPAVAIVGARAASPYGRDVAADLAAQLALAGVTVVSGMARGIDAAAHGGALAAGGQTVAVLGCGVDVAYPPEHADLASRIVASGTLLTERPLGAPPLPWHFPLRNRIIAGMTHGTIVVEAAEGSGSLITARHALEYGREVFAVPGRADSPLSAGPHRLIQQGAKLTTSVDDVLDELSAALRVRARPPAPGVRRTGGRDAACDGTASRILALLAAGPMDVDRLIRESGLGAAEVLSHLLDLELQGRVTRLAGNVVRAGCSGALERDGQRATPGPPVGSEGAGHP